MIVMDPTPMSHLVCILLIVLSGVYVFVLAADLSSYFARGALHIIPVIYAALTRYCSVKLKPREKKFLFPQNFILSLIETRKVDFLHSTMPLSFLVK